MKPDAIDQYKILTTACRTGDVEAVEEVLETGVNAFTRLQGAKISFWNGFLDVTEYIVSQEYGKGGYLPFVRPSKEFDKTMAGLIAFSRAEKSMLGLSKEKHPCLWSSLARGINLHKKDQHLFSMLMEPSLSFCHFEAYSKLVPRFYSVFQDQDFAQQCCYFSVRRHPNVEAVLFLSQFISLDAFGDDLRKNLGLATELYPKCTQHQQKELLSMVFDDTKANLFLQKENAPLKNFWVSGREKHFLLENLELGGKSQHSSIRKM